MDPVFLGLIGLAGMFLLIAAHVPVGVAMAVTGIATFAALAGWGPGLAIVGVETVTAIESLDFAIIPLFLLMGSLATAAGLSSDLFRLANAWLGHRRGGLAVATIGGCAAFGAVCGSSIATVATMTRVALPEMLRRGYRPELAAGSIAAGGTLGILIPPSIILVIYAVLAEQFVLKLFVAAVVPGLIAAALQCAAVGVYVRLNPEAAPAGPRTPWPERARITAQSWAVLLLGLVVTAGIYGGVFTVTEAAAVGAATAFAITLARGRLNWNVLRQVMRETASNTGMIYLIVIGAFTLTYFLALSHMPERTIAWIHGLGLPPLAVIFALYVMYLILGAVFESIAAMVVTLPFVLPLVIGLGYDPVWWGVMLVMISGIGLVTPPIGMNVFVLHGMAGEIGLRTIFRGIAPFLVADALRMIVLTLFPVLTTWLPEAMEKAGLL